MKRILSLLALGLWAVAGTAHARCKIDQIAELPVTLVGSRLLVDAELDGQPVRLILDTGSVSTLLSGRSAQRLGLKPYMPASGPRVSGIGGTAVTLVANVNELSFGKFTLRHDSVIVASDLDYDGLVGRDMFSDYDVEIDVAHGAVRMLRPSGCSDVDMIYWGGASYSEAPLARRDSYLDPYQTEILLNGHGFPAILDTGAPRTTVTTAAAAAAGVRLDTPGSVAAKDTGGLGPRRIPNFSGLFQSVGIGDETVKATRLFVADLWKYNKVEAIGTRLGAIKLDPIYGLIGADFFRSHRVLISPSHHKVFFTYLGGPIFLPYDGTGARAGAASAPASGAPPAPGAK